MHLATHIAVPATLGNGLHRSSVALVEQARFVLREDISRYIGLLEDSVRYQLGEAWILNCDMFAPQIKVLTRRIA
jgi:mRNA-degrading endonuclease toxin of MazEF toxin-antitoxin module